MPYDPFDHYPFPDERLREAPNWSREDEVTFVRSDGAMVTRSSTFAGWVVSVGTPNATRLRPAEVGSDSDLAALDHVDKMFPCAPPPVAVGQIWCDSLIESMVLVVQRIEGEDTLVHMGGIDEAMAWEIDPTDPAALVFGPGAPWVGSGWVNRDQIVNEDAVDEEN